MDNNQITRILRAEPRTDRIFRGCFPLDRLPEPNDIRYPAALVINLDTHNFAGSHWIGIYASGRREVCIFDSLALSTSPLLEEFLNGFQRRKRNTRPYQSITANTCGHHVISFIHYMSSDPILSHYLKVLNEQENPDLFVKSIVSKLIN
jgi:hypothetical protein